jgi:hypothetical protein
MVQDAAVGVVGPPGKDWKYKMFVPQTNQQGQVSSSGVSGVQIPGHILPMIGAGFIPAQSDHKGRPYGFKYFANKSVIAL